LFGWLYPHNTYTLTYTDDEKVWDVNDLPLFPNFLNTINHGLSPAMYEVNPCLNQGNPHLIEFVSTFTNSCTSGGSGRIIREGSFWKTINVQATTEIEKTLGFKMQSAFPKDAVTKFIEISNKLDIAKLKLATIDLSANVRFAIGAGEVLQISFRSDNKEPVELWIYEPDGTWLFAGVITFDKDGKAILPPLQFNKVGNYSLVLSTPSTDSAMTGAPLNFNSQVLISVI
jgi:hypothetical protein